MRRLLAAAALAVVLAACGGGDDEGGGDTTVAFETIPDLIPGPGDPNQIGQAEGVACDVERDALDAVLVAFGGVEGTPPASIQALIDAGYLTDPGGLTQRWEIVDGELQGVTGGPCEGS